MKSQIVSFAIAIAVASSAVFGDISVCVNPGTGKARFGTKCSSKEVKEFIGSGGGLRVITKDVSVPVGTKPPTGGETWNPDSWDNAITEMACTPSEEIFKDDLTLSYPDLPKDCGYNSVNYNLCKEIQKSNCRFDPIVGEKRRLFCAYDNNNWPWLPTKSRIEAHMRLICVKR